MPVIASDPSGTEAAIFEGIANRVAIKIEDALESSELAPPRIVIQ